MDWQTILLIVFGVLLVIGGGYIRKLVKEIKEFWVVVGDALEDGDITKEELVEIFKEAKDVKTVIMEIIKLFARR